MRAAQYCLLSRGDVADLQQLTFVWCLVCRPRQKAGVCEYVGASCVGGSLAVCSAGYVLAGVSLLL